MYNSYSGSPVRKSKGTSIAGFVLGMVTLCFAWIIFVNAVSVITGLAGTVISIISLARKNSGLKVLAVIGLIASLIGMIFSVLMWASFWSDDVYQFLEPVAKLLY